MTLSTSILRNQRADSSEAASSAASRSVALSGAGLASAVRRTRLTKLSSLLISRARSSQRWDLARSRRRPMVLGGTILLSRTSSRHTKTQATPVTEPMSSRTVKKSKDLTKRGQRQVLTGAEAPVWARDGGEMGGWAHRGGG